MYIRKSVYSINGGNFGDGGKDDILYWYAKGVGVLQQRQLNINTSWGFLAAIHGFDTGDWQEHSLTITPMASPADQKNYWNQCQHATWYFVPWHRGYLVSLEAIVRDAIQSLKGPYDTWALPYWNYSDTTNPQARYLPPAFSRTTLPDGSPNPLFVSLRYGPFPIPSRDVTLECLGATAFTGARPYFGGNGPSLFSHFGNSTGWLESKPHNIVHGDVGGFNTSTQVSGLMSDPYVAGYDPIFYLHHANIDRLWQVWLNEGNVNPSDSGWLNGPTNQGFMVPMPNGQGWKFAPQDVLSTTSINPLGYNSAYEYDDTQPAPSVKSATQVRLETLQNAVGKPNLSFSVEEPMNENEGELIGANDEKMSVQGKSIHTTHVHLAKEMLNKTNVSFDAALGGEGEVPEPDHIYLNIENIRAKKDGHIIDVYVNLPEEANPAQYPELYAGAIAFFGIASASEPDNFHGGSGRTELFDITPIVDDLHLTQGIANLSDLKVSLVPRNEIGAEANITVDRISVYRQGK